MFLARQRAFHREQRAQHAEKEAFHREVGALFPHDISGCGQSQSPSIFSTGRA
jgi:hypothetical protein